MLKTPIVAILIPMETWPAKRARFFGLHQHSDRKDLRYVVGADDIRMQRLQAGLGTARNWLLALIRAK